MQFIKSFMVITIVVAISACSTSAPSESDAKKVVQSMLGDCRYLSLESFERVNGVPQGENNYQVAIKYSIKVTPVPENARIIGELSEKLSEINERLEKARNEGKEIQEKMDAIPSNAGKEYRELYSRSWEVGSLADKIEREKIDLINNAINPDAKFAAECPNVSMALYADLFNGDDINQYAKNFTKEFAGTVGMIKTDKGWMQTN